MPPDAKPRTRSYKSALRTEQARLTRQRTVDAARELFLAGGYARTTVSDVARAAEVSPETVYAVFDGKYGLLQGVIDATIMGPTGVPLEEQAEWDEIAALPSARERLRAYVEASCAVLARTSPVHNVIRAAADSEPRATELQERLLADRLAANTKRLRSYVGTELRAGLSLKRAADRYCALTSPEFHHLLTVQLGWSARAHREWLMAMVELELLDD